MEESVVLLGASKVGKSKVAGVLAERLGLPVRATSAVSLPQYKEFGYDDKVADKVWDEQGPIGHHRYCESVNLRALQHLFGQSGGAIYDLQPDYSVFSDPTLYNEARELLLPHNNVVLLQEMPDVEEAAEILRRKEADANSWWETVNRHFLEHKSNYELAKITIYTKDRTPEQSAAEIMSKLDPNSREIFLIGPINSGKTTLGKLIAAQTGLPQLSLDVLRWKYYEEIGYDAKHAADLRANEGLLAMLEYWQPFNAYGVERGVAEHRNMVMDFGGGHSVYEDPALFERVKRALEPFPNVVLVLPSPDKAESLQILKERELTYITPVWEWKEWMLRQLAAADFAKKRVYTNGKDLQQIADEILASS
jgi:adenylate kinase family enzyme